MFKGNVIGRYFVSGNSGFVKLFCVNYSLWQEDLKLKGQLAGRKIFSTEMPSQTVF